MGFVVAGECWLGVVGAGWSGCVAFPCDATVALQLRGISMRRHGSVGACIPMPHF